MKHRPLLPSLLLATLLAASVGLASAQSARVTVATGLNAPMGLHVSADGALYLVEAGYGGDEVLRMIPPGAGEAQDLPFGPTSRLLRLDPSGGGDATEVAVFPSVHMGMDVSGASRVVTHDGAYFVTSGAWLETDGESPPEWVAEVVRVDGASGALATVSDTWALERDENPDGHILESHPFGLTVGPDGMLYVADAGANVLLRIDPSSGATEIVAVFADGVPGFVPNAQRGGATENDPVPTAVVFAPNGDLLVSFLPGFPPLPGTGQVVRVADDGTYQTVADGSVMLTDLTVGPDGAVYAIRMADFGEQGPQPMTGAIVRMEDGGFVEVVGELSFPTAVAFDASGAAYVTLNGVGAPGSGEVVRFDGVATN